MKLLTIIMKKVHRNSIKITVDLWGNPLTTKELFAYVRETGFDFVRIPVTYKNHFKMEPGYEIDKAWLDRVQQIVDYALECDLKVIINIHHDCTTSGDNKIWFIAYSAVKYYTVLFIKQNRIFSFSQLCISLQKAVCFLRYSFASFFFALFSLMDFGTIPARIRFSFSHSASALTESPSRRFSIS